MRRVLGIATASAVLLSLAGCARRTCCAPRCDPPVARAIAYPAPAPVLPAPPRAAERQVFLDTIIYRVPRAHAGAVLGPKDGESERAYHLLSEAEAAALRERAAKEPAVVTLAMPKVLTLLGQEATVFAGETYEPVGHTVDARHWAGHRLRAVTRPSADGKGLAIDLAFALRDPPPKDAKPDLVALAANEVRGEMGVAKMQDGQSVLMVVAVGPAEPRDRIAILTAVRELPSGAAAP